MPPPSSFQPSFLTVAEKEGRIPTAAVAVKVQIKEQVKVCGQDGWSQRAVVDVFKKAHLFSLNTIKIQLGIYNTGSQEGRGHW